jgi:hypothetical protein|tara:strand:+ start:135 stop:749 length:615 start_codon:yes stop_codon:yes gene_type:complete
MGTLNQSQFNKSRLDKFLLVLSLPPILKDINQQYLGSRKNTSIIENSLQFSVYGSIVPPIKVPQENVYYAGQSMKISKHTRPVYENVTVNFTIDNEFNNYWLLYKWLDLLNDEKISAFNGKDIFNKPNIHPSEKRNPNSLTPAELYQADFTLFQKDEFDKNKVKFVFTKAFPVQLGGINFNYRTPGEIETTFEFAFSQLLVELV